MTRVVVDVGIPTGGRSTYLRDAVESALRQTLSAIHVTVGENGAGNVAVRDALAPFARDSRLTHVVNGTDLGPAHNFTRVAQGDAPYLALLHDDDLWGPEFLENRVAFLEANPTCGFVFSSCVLIDAEGIARDVWDVDLRPGVHAADSFLPAIYLHNLVPVPTAVVRREAYDAVGGRFHDILFNDHELWLRLGSAFDVGFLPSPDASYRVHDDQTTFAHLRRLGEHRIEFQESIDAILGERIPRSLRRRAAASAHLHVAADAVQSGRPATAVREVGRAAKASPGLVLEPRELRRSGLLLVAALLGRPGRGLWMHRREVGRRRRDAEAARRVTGLRAQLENDGPPAFSVVVPARDASETIGATIESVLMQTDQDFEIVVVDDGSTDTTAAVAVERGGARVRIHRAHGVGVSAARNVGIAAARGRWVSFLDADDLWLPGYLAAMRDAFEHDPGLGLAFTDAWVLDEAAGAIRRVPMMARRRPRGPLPRGADLFFDLLLRGNFVYTSATVPRSVLECVSGYDTSLARAEDYDLWLRITAAGFPAAYRPGPLAVYRLRPNSLSTDRLAMARGECAALENLLRRSGLSDHATELVSGRIEELRAWIAVLGSGRERRASVSSRAWRRLERLARNGTLYRVAPPEVVGGFPELPVARPFAPSLKRTASAPGA